MAENSKYTKLYELPANLYFESLPVIIRQGQLLRDNTNSSIKVKIKMQNIEDKNIRSIDLDVLEFDENKKYMDSKHFVMARINVACNQEFEASIPIILKADEIKYFNIKFNSVTFADETTWENEKNKTKYRKIKKPIDIKTKLVSRDMINTFNRETKIFARNLPNTQYDLWQCFCGAINRKKSLTCNVCKKDIKNLLDKFYQIQEKQKLKIEEEKEQVNSPDIIEEKEEIEQIEQRPDEDYTFNFDYGYYEDEDLISNEIYIDQKTQEKHLKRVKSYIDEISVKDTKTEVFKVEEIPEREKTEIQEEIEEIPAREKLETQEELEKTQASEKPETQEEIGKTQASEKTESQEELEKTQASEKTESQEELEEIQSSEKPEIQEEPEKIQSSENLETQEEIEKTQASEKLETQEEKEEIQASEKLETQEEKEEIQASEKLETQEEIEEIQSSEKLETQEEKEEIQAREKLETQEEKEEIQAREKLETQEEIEEIQAREKLETQEEPEKIQSSENLETQEEIEEIQSSEKLETQEEIEEIQSSEKLETQEETEKKQESEKLEIQEEGLNKEQENKINYKRKVRRKKFSFLYAMIFLVIISLTISSYRLYTKVQEKAQLQREKNEIEQEIKLKDEESKKIAEFYNQAKEFISAVDQDTNERMSFINSVLASLDKSKQNERKPLDDYFTAEILSGYTETFNENMEIFKKISQPPEKLQELYENIEKVGENYKEFNNFSMEKPLEYVSYKNEYKSKIVPLSESIDKVKTMLNTLDK